MNRAAIIIIYVRTYVHNATAAAASLFTASYICVTARIPRAHFFTAKNIWLHFFLEKMEMFQPSHITIII